VNQHAALMVKDSEALNKVVPMIIALSRDTQQQEEMKTNIGRLAITNADEVIAAEVLKAIN